MNDALHWNSVADNYDTEIFNVFKNDKKKKLRKYLAKYANKNNIAIDFGCGVGKALPMLSPLFKGIIAIDVSKKCISIARSSPHKNVVFKQADLAGKKIDVPSVDFAFCCNVAMSDNVRRNVRIIKNVLNALNKGGAALFVLPSYESTTIAMLSLMKWYEKEGIALSEIPTEELSLLRPRKKSHVRDGILMIGDVPTKHYTAAELYTLFNEDGFRMEKLDRVEYSWETEFNSPPAWMQEPYPWDWVVEVKRVR